MANPKIILNESFPTNFLEGLNKLRSSSSFCDITLQIEDQRFPAHKCVLVSASKYFENMLKGKYVENQAETINLKELNSNAFEILLNYMYSGVLSIDCANAGEVLKLSDYLQLNWPKNESSKYLLDSLTLENAVGIWEYGRECFCDELQNQANKLILTNLKTILNTDEFRKLDLQKLQEILQHDQMLSTQADDVFIGIIEWIKHDIPNRKLCFNSLSKYIRGGSISDECLKSSISKETLLREDISITNWMLDNLLFSRTKENDHSNKGPAEPLSTNIFMSSLCSVSNCYKYDTKMNESTLVKKLCLDDYYPVLYKHDIYFTCGKVNNVYKKVCPKYNIETETWTEIPFESDRYFHGSCVLNDKMYIIGGKSAGDVFRNDVKTYDFEIGELISLESKMNEKRAYFGIAVQNGSIYTCGGLGCDYEELNSVERFDPREGKWVLIPDMEDLRGFCSSAFVSDELYCSARWKEIVKKFDIRMNSWEGISNLPSDGNNCLVTNQGELCAVTPKHIYQYNRNGNKWNQIYSQSLYCLNSYVIATSY